MDLSVSGRQRFHSFFRYYMHIAKRPIYLNKIGFIFNHREIMVNFVDAEGAYAAITHVIKNCQKELIIISPYINIPENIKKHISERYSKNIPITFVYRKDSPVEPIVQDYLQSLDNAKKLFCDKLHAKCYFNEHMAVVTSMNLLESSMKSNWEMGFVVKKDEDGGLYNQIYDEISKILHQCETTPVIKRDKVTVTPKTSTVPSIQKNIGHCIRCGLEIPLNPLRPLCYDCYDMWAEFSNPDYIERFCHRCGHQSPTTFNKPLCKDCYRRS